MEPLTKVAADTASATRRQDRGGLTIAPPSLILLPHREPAGRLGGGVRGETARQPGQPADHSFPAARSAVKEIPC
jgi:hypothetical protein